MNTKQQPEALRLAEMLTADEWPGSVTLVSYARECVAELLRQHAENETLRAGYAAARLEIESLKAQLHAAKQINAAQFGLLAASIPGSALRASHGQAPAETGNSVSAQTDSVQEDLLDAAFEAVRKRLCGMQRYSFVLDDDGLVRRVQDRTGNWIEFDEAHALFDPVSVDAAIAAQGNK